MRLTLSLSTCEKYTKRNVMVKMALVAETLLSVRKTFSQLLWGKCHGPLSVLLKHIKS